MKNIELYLVAKDLMEERKNIEALKILEELLEINPSNSSIEFSIAKIKSRNKKTYNEAKELFKKILKGHNEYASQALLELGKIEVTERNYNKAESHFNKLIKRENNFPAYIELAKLEVKLRNFDKAKSLLEVVINANEQYCSLALFELGKLQRKLGNINESINCFEQIGNHEVHLNKIWIQMGMFSH